MCIYKVGVGLVCVGIDAGRSYLYPQCRPFADCRELRRLEERKAKSREVAVMLRERSKPVDHDD